MTEYILSKAGLNKFQCESDPKNYKIGIFITTILSDKNYLVIHSPPIQFTSDC